MNTDRGAAPDPDQAADLADFIRLLGELRVWAGQPSYRDLAKRVGPLLRPPQTLPPSTVVDVFKTKRRRLDIGLVTAIVRALDLAEPEVARWRAACVRVHAHANRGGGSSGVFRQLPADLATFTGRRRELDALLATSAGAKTDGARTVVVTAIEGMAGVGKTQLAVHAAHELLRRGRYTDVQLYVNLRGFDADQDPADPSDVLDAFLRQLEVPAQEIPSNPDERAAMFRDRLHGRHALVVLDNAADEQQVRPLIPATPTCLVLITSRRSLAGLEGAGLHVLDVFTKPEALDLLARIAGAERIAAEPVAAEQLIETCGRLPIAVALAGSRLRARPTWKLGDLLDHLHSRGLDAVAVGGQAVRHVFDLSYQGLPEPSRQMFCALGLHRGRDATAATAAALAGVGESDAREQLEALQDEHLLQQQIPGRYTMHDLIRGYAAERAAAELPAAERTDAVDRLVRWYYHGVEAASTVIAPHRSALAQLPEIDRPGPAIGVPTFQDHESALDWLTVERGNAGAVLRQALDSGLDQLAEALARSLTDFYASQAYWDDYAEAQRIRIEAARRFGDGKAQAEALNALARAFLELERTEEALDAGLAARELVHDTDWIRLRAATTETVALVHYGRQELEESLPWFLAALELRRADDYAFGLSATLNNTANVYLDTGRLEEGFAAQEEAIAIVRAAGLTVAEGFLLCAHGISLQDLGRLDRAAAVLRESLGVFTQLGDRRNEAMVLEKLAVVLDQADEPMEALACREHAAHLLAQAEAVEG